MATTPPAMLTISITQPATATVLIHIAISNRVSDNTNKRMPPYLIKLKFGQRLRRCNVHLCSSQLLIRYFPDKLWNWIDDSTDSGILWILGGRPAFPGRAALRLIRTARRAARIKPASLARPPATATYMSTVASINSAFLFAHDLF